MPLASSLLPPSRSSHIVAWWSESFAELSRSKSLKCCWRMCARSKFEGNDEARARTPYSQSGTARSRCSLFYGDLEPSLKISRGTSLNSPKVPLHLKQFHEELKSVVPQLKKILVGVSSATPCKEIRTPKNEKRGVPLSRDGSVRGARYCSIFPGTWVACYHCCGDMWSLDVSKRAAAENPFKSSFGPKEMAS